MLRSLSPSKATTASAPIEERYQLQQAIGVPGSYGVVVGAVHRATGEHVAVKVVNKTTTMATIRDRIRADMVKSEAMIMSTVRHEHVVDVIEVAETQGKVYLVMKMCHGGDLFDRIVAHGGRIGEEVAAAITLDLCHALRYLHRQRIVHGDLKLSNIMFEDSSDRSVRIIDFGLSQVQLKDTVPLTTLVGTPNYQSPDVIRGEYSFAADVWSLGVVLFVMVFGFNPFDPFGVTDDSYTVHKRVLDGFMPSTLSGFGAFFPADIPASPDLKDLIGRMLKPDPSARIRLFEVLDHKWMRKVDDTAATVVALAPCA